MTLTFRTSAQHSILQAIEKILLDFHFRSLKQPAAVCNQQRPKSQLFFGCHIDFLHEISCNSAEWSEE